ncbi:outer membrane lipoprotein-sorting protein [Stackebrandtia endophytica]|uniref:Outer membrane lipoprotein-sorting protein n=1 Tax=Stackebrandtia endophytica TaxID=1496996 RepID=A0A543ARJ4_9ACTN|nr:sigma-E factor regulatory protein RseB domain-containing protein [Stackebrandtia endophytica]TQL75203.1 outer membrane lipoprotein-sorting protein [Stackebrandtia endophytica]
MSRTRTMRRFAVPLSIAAVAIAVVAGAGIVSAEHPPELPARSAAELLADVQNSDVPGVSGTVVSKVELGLPNLPGDLLEPGSRTLRMWYASPDKVRVAMLDKLGEADLIRNGEDVWTWDSRQNTAVHYTLPDRAAGLALWPPNQFTGTSPMEAAEQMLASIEPGTTVTTDGTAEIAGRSAYELILEPKDSVSLVDQVRLAIDSETGLPLRTQVIAVGATEPAFEVAFSRIEFDVPDAENFTFNPPAGVEVVEGTDVFTDLGSTKPEHDGEITTVGEGWNTVAVVNLDAEALFGSMTEDVESRDDIDVDLSGLFEQFPAVSGDWGSGRLITSALVTALVTDDGRVLVGAVTPERLYDVAA